MSGWSIAAVALIRLVMTLAPLRGLLNRDFQEFGFAAGGFRREADELLGATNARIVLYSWPLLTLAALFTRVHELNQTLEPIAALICVGITFLLLFLFYQVPARSLRGTVRATLVAVGAIVADVLVAIFLDEITCLITAVPTPP